MLAFQFFKGEVVKRAWVCFFNISPCGPTQRRQATYNGKTNETGLFDLKPTWLSGNKDEIRTMNICHTLLIICRKKEKTRNRFIARVLTQFTSPSPFQTGRVFFLLWSCFKQTDQVAGSASSNYTPHSICCILLICATEKPAESFLTSRKLNIFWYSGNLYHLSSTGGCAGGLKCIIDYHQISSI